MNAEQAHELHTLIRSFGYTTNGQTTDLVEGIRPFLTKLGQSKKCYYSAHPGHICNKCGEVHPIRELSLEDFPTDPVEGSTGEQILNALKNADWVGGPPHERIKDLIEGLKQVQADNQALRAFQEIKPAAVVTFGDTGVIRRFVLNNESLVGKRVQLFTVTRNPRPAT